jgi:hypothetical protein
MKNSRSWIRAGFRMGVGAALLAAALAVVPERASASITYFMLQAVSDDRCLSVTPPGGAGEHLAFQGPCVPDQYGSWTLQPSDNGTYRIVNPERRCLEVLRGSLNDGADIRIANCNADWRQQWWRNGTPAGNLEFANRRSEKCLDGQRPAGPSGLSSVRQYGCHGGTTQQWRLI